MLPVLPFDTLHVIAGGETTRLQEARGLRTPVRETCAATGVEAPATSAEYRGITRSWAIFVPDNASLNDRPSSIKRLQVIADIGHVPG